MQLQGLGVGVRAGAGRDSQVGVENVEGVGNGGEIGGFGGSGGSERADVIKAPSRIEVSDLFREEGQGLEGQYATESDFGDNYGSESGDLEVDQVGRTRDELAMERDVEQMERRRGDS